ncbi:MAG: acetylglutamate kinase [Desulfurella sp.]|uniref:acetylglutamate kinase n=1 Tax=Desulfurella TaxID=33001 RepID=UPI0003E0A6F1|nr:MULTISPECIES: acetylglutamate kinase [Desulfurella]AHF97434.1 acetylglutamate kinase [Desulfurella acetivorans A63]PMP65358.1 MAG: acetylglutamate kinase [Desulfurella multipotens]PMP92101.1 MAG: acetylglutamate kinase [Desulfurella sp.]HEX14218.1 acetylglutamate kinase [Desulfurella acetivorans]
MYKSEKGQYLVEFLPYIKEFYGNTFVIKYGGSAMINDELKMAFSKDIALLKLVGINPIIVHGGGNEIGDTLKKLDITTKFHKGLRITDEKTMEVVVMVLAGKVNKEIVLNINRFGGKAVGLSGVDANIIKAKKLLLEDVDLGLVGDVEEVNPDILVNLSKNGYIPVVSPIGFDDAGSRYNINADTVASSIAQALQAEKLIYISDVDGVLDTENKLISEIKIKDIDKMIGSVLTGGMIPKVISAKEAIENGVKKVHIINGKKQHAILEEIFTDAGIGTQIVR